MLLYRELRRRLADDFAAAGIESAAVEADLLLTGLGGFRRSELFFLAGEPVPEELAARLLALAERRVKREPLQYLLGLAPFRELELEVTPAVLIPRPETELLVDWLIRRAPMGARLLDLGTGSGAIALSAAFERPDLAVTGVDLSPAALEVAKRNRARYGLERVRLLESDLFAAVEGEQFDWVAANLPYVTDAEYETLEPEVRRHEPRLALTAPEEGMEVMLRSVLCLAEFLAPGGGAIYELSPPQAPLLAEALEREGGFEAAELLEDYTGRIRFVAVRKLDK